MCDYVEFVGTPFEANNLAQLRSLGMTIEESDYEKNWNDMWCLCGVDVEAILDHSGYDSEWSCGGYIATPKVAR